MPPPTHAIVIASTVTGLALMDLTTAEQFRSLGFVEQLWPGGTLVDVTDLDPQPLIGWTYDGQTFAPASESP